MHLVLLETSGNQNFIFSTNKLRENFGASELTYRVCTEWVLQAVEEIGGLALWDEGINQLRQNLLRQQPIELSGLPVEVVLASSGKALLLVQQETRDAEHDLAQQIVSHVTRRALQDAPGVDVCGTVLEFNWKDDRLGEISQKIRQQALLVAAQRSGVSDRFLQIPVVAQCVTSGLPAERLYPAPDGSGQLEARSTTSLKKEGATDSAFRRLLKLYEQSRETEHLRFVTQIDELETVMGASDWLGIIHADGNGLGEIFINFHQHIQALDPTKNRSYIDKIRRFSIALDICTEQAFLTAVSRVFKNFQQETEKQPMLPSQAIPLIPLILGGDDLTVICGGQYALRFTQEFLKAFEVKTQDATIQGGIIPEIAGAALAKPRLSACAGIAIAKPHFPFSIAYSLSAQLIESAKQVKHKIKGNQDIKKLYPCSAIDFHILYDSSNVDLKQIRQKLQVDWRSQDSKAVYQTRLYGRPLITTELEDDISEESDRWAKHHYWGDFVQRVQALKAGSADPNQPNSNRQERLLPASQAHELREGLFLGQRAADARLRLIWQRYEQKDANTLNPLIVESTEAENQSISLFWQETGEPQTAPIVNVTGFLDAIDALEISKNWEK